MVKIPLLEILIVKSYRCKYMGCDWSQPSPLLKAMSRGDLIQANEFIRRGKYLKTVDPLDATTPLIRSMELNQRELTRLILDRSHDPVYLNHRNRLGNTALHVACQLGDAEIAHLLDAKMIPRMWNICNHRGMTPIMVAIDCGHEELTLNLLRNHRWDPDQINRDGDTMFMLACRREMESVARILVRHHQRFNYHDLQGKTVLDLAKIHEMPDIVNRIRFQIKHPETVTIDTTYLLNHSGPMSFRTGHG